MSGECGGCGGGGVVIGLEAAAVVTRLILCRGGGGTWRVLEGPPPTPPTPPTPTPTPPIPGPGGGGRSGMRRRCGGGVPDPAASDWASEWRIIKSTIIDYQTQSMSI